MTIYNKGITIADDFEFASFDDLQYISVSADIEERINRYVTKMLDRKTGFFDLVGEIVSDTFELTSLERAITYMYTFALAYQQKPIICSIFVSDYFFNERVRQFGDNKFMNDLKEKLLQSGFKMQPDNIVHEMYITAAQDKKFGENITLTVNV